MSLSSNFPAVKPSLLLDFANTKQLDPRVTFARATTATYYDGVTTAKAEENLITYSQEFDNAAWSKREVTISANSTTAPDGTSTADTITPTTANDYHYIYLASTPSGVTNACFSVYAKANGYNNLFIRSNTDGTYRGVNFNVSTGVVSAVENGVSGAITSVGNGWYRCSVNFSGYTISSQTQILVNQDATSSTPPWVANGTSGIFIWGAQIESNRSSPTAYTATTTQPITNYIPVLMTAAAGVPRFDHNPTTDESLGLLIEEQRTNSLTYSEDLSNAAWTVDNTGTLVANQAIAPTGTLTADLVRDSTSSGAPRLIRTSPFNPGGSSFTYSIYAKSYGAKRNVFLLAQESANAFYAHFDIVAGTVVQSSGNGPGTLISAVIQSVGNGWFRISISGTTPGSTSTYLIANSEAPGSTGFGAGNYTGDGFSGVLFWGAQLETNSAPFATSYIPTVASTVTRNADQASMTGTNFSSWFSADQGTLVVISATARVNSEVAPVAIEGVSPARIRLSYIPSLYAYALYQNTGGSYVSISSSPTSVPASNLFNTSAMTYSTNIVRVATGNGSAIGGAVTFSPSPLTYLTIGNSPTDATTMYQNGRIKKLAYYPIAVTAAQLQALTS